MAMLAFRAMGSSILAILERADDRADAELQHVRACFATWEQTLSRFRPDSELSMLNRAGGGWATISPTLASVLVLALEVAAQTDGLVTPTVLDALEQAGYDRDFGLLAAISHNRSAPGSRGQSADWRRIRWDAARQRVAVPAGVRLDLGGVAKGWAADRAVAWLAPFGPALVDAGGDISISGPRADGTAWPIAVSDPFDADASLDLLLLSSGAVATSGRDLRHWRMGSREYHHIIDPRRGAPAETDLLSVTVVAASAAEAEAAAKVVLILGSTAGYSWLADRPWLAGLLVCADRTILRTATLEAYRWAADRQAASR